LKKHYLKTYSNSEAQFAVKYSLLWSKEKDTAINWKQHWSDIETFSSPFNTNMFFRPLRI